MNQEKKKLFSEFPSISTAEWEAVILKDLKGADYEKKLIWKTNEGLSVKPYYRAEDLQHIPWLASYPGDFPFVRGNNPTANHWLVRQDIQVDTIASANEKALDILMKGIDSIGFELNCDKQYSIEEIEALLKNIRADIVELNFYSTAQHFDLVRYIDTLVRKYNRPLEKIFGSVSYDPLLRYARRGVWYDSEEADFCTAYEMINASKALPNFRVLTVNGHLFTNSGANIVEEMAFTLSAGSEYLTRLTAKGLFIGDIAPRIKFNLAVGSNYFLEIAKLRAYRLLWAQLVNAYGLNDSLNGRMFIHAQNSSWNLSIYDAHVNMLRTTTATMSAILGGVDSFRVLPFDSVYGASTEFAERIARNQQLVLKEESYLDKVADPAAGSYYIENLTNMLAEEAWKLFLEIDEEGGFLTALKKGIIQKKINASADKRRQAIATRRETLLGINQYPDLTGKIDRELLVSVFQPDDRTDKQAEIETIKTCRGAQQFELLRYTTDQYSKTHKRPTVWLLPFGNQAMRSARANFASNFFACAGFEIVNNPGFETVEQGIEAARESGAEIVVLCSSDDEYATNALTIFNALKKTNEVVLAGYPTNLVDTLKTAGMEYFIHVRSNVLETLQQFQQRLGITQQ